jgi:ATP phosphoribosyltransferase
MNERFFSGKNMLDKEKEFKFAIQTVGGRLYEGSKMLLNNAGLLWSEENRQLVYPTSFLEESTQLGLMKPADIVREVAEGNIQMGIVGQDSIRESRLNVKQLFELGFGQCTLYLAAPEFLDGGIKAFDGRRIATSYPNTTEDFFRMFGINICTRIFVGAVEGTVGLNLADAIVDIVETGTTLSDNGLKRICKVWDSEAVLITNPDSKRGSSDIQDRLTERIFAARIRNYPIPYAKDEAQAFRDYLSKSGMNLVEWRQI